MRRGTDRAVYDIDTMKAVLDAGLVAHVGISTDEGPVVLPMAYGRTDDTILLHGAAANALLKNATGTEVCVTVTIVDGLVIARAAFHNSMNYRSVVIRGLATKVEGDDKVEALQIITDHVVRNWDTGRPSTDAEIRKTLVVSVPLTEMSAKIRGGDPIDDDADLDGPHWSGTIPLDRVWGAPESAADLHEGIEVRAEIRALEGRSVN